MVNLKHTNTLIFEKFKTEFYTEKKLLDFLLSESIPCLSCRFKVPEDFYNSIIFKLPNGKDHTNYKMIYYNSEKIKEENIISKGSVKLMDTSLKSPPIINWIIIKS